jgi:hypothetical protein
MVACVKISGDLTRLFKTTETSSPNDDLELKYVKYQMHAMIGTTSGGTIQDVLQFEEKTVDLNTFNLP